MAVLSKVIISALIIGFVTEISKRHPTYGGIILALPLVSLLSLFWMQIQGEKTAQLSQFASGVLTGIPVCSLFTSYFGFFAENSCAVLVCIMCWNTRMGYVFMDAEDLSQYII
nr:DUF3147 family protein [Bacillus subtilis]